MSEVKEINNDEEKQYLDQIKLILETGVKRQDRTGTGTLSLFGSFTRWNLRDGRIPLLTTRRIFWKGVVEELLWMIRGSTDAKELDTKGVTIWNANGSRDFLDKCGLTENEEGDLGPVYGFQWRHFGAEYKGCKAKYEGKNAGVDQLAGVIKMIKENPDSRRILLSSWHPTDIQKMALPPCHVLCQFYVANGELSCMMYQRSGDMGLGVPFNIASYSLLTIMIAHICDLKPGEFIHSLGDAHVYLNHVDALKEQIKRTPFAFPKLKIDDSRKIKSIDDFKFDDFTLVGYKAHQQIAMEMSL